MASYSRGYEENLKRAIRDAIAIDLIAGIHQLTDTLSKRLNHSFDPRCTRGSATKSFGKTSSSAIALGLKIVLQARERIIASFARS